MAMQAGVQTSKVLILLGAGVSGSIVLRHKRLSDLIAQLHDLLKGAEGVESTPYEYDGALLAAQIRQLANEIKELSMTNPVTIFNGDSNSNGYASYLVPEAAMGAIGYGYMWWKGWSFSDAMFVTKKNMANAVASVVKAKRHISEFLRQRIRQRDFISLHCDMMQEDADLLSRKLSRCWRCFVRQKKTTLDLAKAYALKITESLPFEQLAVLIESHLTLKAVKSLLDRLSVSA